MTKADYERLAELRWLMRHNSHALNDARLAKFRAWAEEQRTLEATCDHVKPNGDSARRVANITGGASCAICFRILPAEKEQQ